MSGECLDRELTKQLGSLVEELTTTGSPSLDAQLMKKFKKICRTSDLYVEHAFRLLMTQLSEEHAEIRLSTFQMMNELFDRSHAFRELLVSDFQHFLELTAETDQQHQPLPPPKGAAQKLKSDTLNAVQQWQEKFGEAYKKLALGYNYLKSCKHVNFSDIRARSLAEQRRQEQQELRKQKALAAKLDKARKEIAELQKEITDTATEAESCIGLLLPKPDSLFADSDFASGADTTDNSVNTGSKSQTSSPTSSQQKTCSSTTVSDSQNSCENGSNTTEQRSVTNSSDESSKNITPTNPLDSVDLSLKDGKRNGSAEADSIKVEQDSVPVISQTNSDSISDQDEDDDNDSDEDNFEAVDLDEAEERGLVRTHGLGNRNYNLQIEIETEGVRMNETEDNKDLFHSLKDSSCLITMRHLPQVVKWLEVLSKTGGSQAEIKSLIDLKVRLEQIRRKCTDLHVVPQASSQGEQSESDEEMEEVPEKEGFEPVIPNHLRAEYGLDPISTSSNKPSTASNSSATSKTSSSSSTSKAETASKSGTSGSVPKITAAHWGLMERNKSALVEDPTSRAANIVKLGLEEEAGPSTSNDNKPATVTSETDGGVPTLSFGLDLAYWGTPDKMEAPAVVKNDSLHRFWVPAQVENEKPSQNEMAAVLNRTFHYTGQFVPVKWKCRAPLPSGKLCERMDRVKCPFHGKIIARDEDGIPANPEDMKKELAETSVKIEAESTSEEKTEVPPWLDADLQAQIEAATGHDLGSARSRKLADKGKEPKGKGKGKGKKKYDGLTNINATKCTSRSRLEAKVFNKGAIKRVASALDAADYKRVRDKFGNQFNYTHSN
ncbi:UV-stimulated scaffold protein A-like isoform X2 [Littorina saxatilis]|uniref:UV-stimulated scaffold protein A-like isoform X2 n=1 Tax=Littorina saxatilis TaxID=31220 RepID=UPI0038B4D2EA